MIVSSRSWLASNLHHYLTPPSLKSMQNHFSYAFSSIQKKADQFICAATALLTLKYTDPDSLFNLEPSYYDNIFKPQNLLKINHPTSLRQKVVYHLNELQVFEKENKVNIIDLFKMNKGFELNKIEVQQRIRMGASTKIVDNQEKQFFVFNPTFLFKELLDFFRSRKYPFKRLLIGSYGIGKSSNQMLATILTNYLFHFRKQGQQAHKYIQDLIKKNELLFKFILNYDELLKKNSLEDLTFVQYVKGQLFHLPLVLYYSLPNDIPEDGIRFTLKDILKYFSQEQINKFPQKSSKQFCKQIKKICLQNNMFTSLVIDQSNFYFKTLRNLQNTKQKWQRIQKKYQKQQITPKILNQKQLEEEQKLIQLNKRAKLYGKFFDQVAKIFQQHSSIVLSCSGNVEYPFPISQDSRELSPIYQTNFFSKQGIIYKYELKYERQINSRRWQNQMDLVFWFELQGRILEQLDKKDKKFQNKLTALSLLKHYYSHLIANDQLNRLQEIQNKKEESLLDYQQNEKKVKFSWTIEARHMLIHQAIINQQSSPQINKVINIIDLLAENIIKNKESSSLLLSQHFIKKFVEHIKILRKIVKKNCVEKHQINLKLLMKKTHIKHIEFLRNSFVLKLYYTLRALQQQKPQKNQVILNRQQIDSILQSIQIPQSYNVLPFLFDKTYQQLRYEQGEPMLIYHLPLSQLKSRLVKLLGSIDYRNFVLNLLQQNKMVQAIYAQQIMLIILTTQKIDIFFKGAVQETFKITNQIISQFVSLLSLTTKEKMLKTDLQLIVSSKQKHKNNTNLQLEAKQKGRIVKPDSILGENFWKFYQDNNYETITSEVIKAWKLHSNYKTDSIEAILQPLFKSFPENTQQVANLTIGAVPRNKTTKKLDNSPNNPCFDLVLIKKKQKASQNQLQSFKVIVIDVTIGSTQQNYLKKLNSLIQFKNQIMLNELAFFGEIQFQVWILCPQILVKQYSQKWLDIFKQSQVKLDISNKKETPKLALKFVSFDDLQILGKDNDQIRENYRKFVEVINRVGQKMVAEEMRKKKQRQRRVILKRQVKKIMKK